MCIRDRKLWTDCTNSTTCSKCHRSQYVYMWVSCLCSHTVHMHINVIAIGINVLCTCDVWFHNLYLTTANNECTTGTWPRKVSSGKSSRYRHTSRQTSQDFNCLLPSSLGCLLRRVSEYELITAVVWMPSYIVSARSFVIFGVPVLATYPSQHMTCYMYVSLSLWLCSSRA